MVEFQGLKSISYFGGEEGMARSDVFVLSRVCSYSCTALQVFVFVSFCLAFSVPDQTYWPLRTPFVVKEADKTAKSN